MAGSSLLGQFPSSVEVVELPMPLSDVTFIGGRDLPGHRWYKLRPSFAPTLVEAMLEQIRPENLSAVLDPFSGAGTTVLTAKALGIQSFGIELNPFLARLSNYASDWSVPKGDVREAAMKIKHAFVETISAVEHLDLEQAEKQLGIDRPHIHNVLRWWRPDVLVGLLSMKSVLYRQDHSSTEYRLAWLALSTVCIDVANIKRLHPTLSFFDRSGEEINVRQLVLDKIETIAEDLQELADRDAAPVTVVEGSSLLPENFPKVGESTAVITSPPYANRYSYVWETRPHLYMMDLIDKPRESGNLDLMAPGGTWGAATSILQKETAEPRSLAIAKTLKGALEKLATDSPMMRNYVLRYFNMMGEHFEALSQSVSPGSSFAYVVGNSRIKGVDIDTQGCLVAQMIETGSMVPEKVIVFRRRIGRRDLFEVSITGTIQ